MKIYNAQVFKEGMTKGRAWKIIKFEDESGESYSTFDDLVLDVANGTELAGSVTVNDKGYKNFKLDKKSDSNVNVAVKAEEAKHTPAKPAVQHSNQRDDVIVWQNCQNVAAAVVGPKGNVEDVRKLRDMLYEDYYTKFKQPF